MYPILHTYTIAGFERPVAGYGLMLAIGFLAGMALGINRGRRQGLDMAHLGLVAIICILCGLVGSYLLFLITIAPVAWREPSMILQGGLVFYGGPLVAIPVGWRLSRWLGMSPWHVADLAAPTVALGHVWGRMGCFLGGCCYGAPWEGPWAVLFTHALAPGSRPAVLRHPAQLYEAAFLLLGTGALLWLWPRLRRHGELALWYVIAYGAWRFVVEYVRGDADRGFVVPGMISTSQAISLALVVAGFALLRARRRQPMSLPSAALPSPPSVALPSSSAAPSSARPSSTATSGSPSRPGG